jgi:hypothetical protein
VREAEEEEKNNVEQITGFVPKREEFLITVTGISVVFPILMWTFSLSSRISKRVRSTFRSARSVYIVQTSEYRSIFGNHDTPKNDIQQTQHKFYRYCFTEVQSRVIHAHFVSK